MSGADRIRQVLEALGVSQESAADRFKNAVKAATASDSEAMQELKANTTDADAETIKTRALGVYLAAVRCVKGGGRVEFTSGDGIVKALKLPMRKS